MDWQQIVALALVAAAFLWLLRTYVFHGAGKAGCGGCGGCASTSAPDHDLIRPEEILAPPSGSPSNPSRGRRAA